MMADGRQMGPRVSEMKPRTQEWCEADRASPGVGAGCRWQWAVRAVEKGEWARMMLGRPMKAFALFFYFISYSLFSIPKFNLNYKF